MENGQSIGPYRILGRLGEGGMGTVYAAEQTEPVRRRVALKVVRPGLDSREVLGRFELERQALALMHHPNIAKVLHAGSTDDGRPWFAMELVKGDPITAYCDKVRLSVPDRLRLFVQVCHGVQHAHHKGVIHRDLKPSNVLIEILDDQPVARIIDFGLARATNHLLTQHTVFTEVGRVIGTPEYMSPEQAEMSGADVDTRSDVYSLGVLLYELLAGRLPFESSELRLAGLLEIQRRIREVDPPVPSRRVSTLRGESQEVAVQRRLSPPALVRSLKDDLDWIVMRCLEKDRARRYQTPSELAADVERHLRGEPVVAGPPGALYRVRKLLRRHRVAVSVLALVFTTMAVALVLVSMARGAEARERARAEENARRLAEALGEVRAQVDAAQARELVLQAQRLVPVGVGNLAAAQEWLLRARDLLRRVGGGDVPEVAPEQRAALRRQVQEELAGAVAALQERPGWVEQLAGQVEFVAGIAGSDAGPAWLAAARAVAADARFPGLELVPQPGLVPLGNDPDTALPEFAVLQTGTVPARDAATGRLQLDEDSAIVLVLLPGGEARVGAGDDDELGVPLERPQVRVPLEPFLLGKHEITRAQWQRMTGLSPNRWTEQNGPPRQVGPRNPVEMVSWQQAEEWLPRYGLTLPTEAQWEWAARAGTSTRWWTGHERQGLVVGGPAENIADAATVRAGAQFTGAQEWPDYDDGLILHGPVGSLRANPWGLFDVLGNVKEWCRDGWHEGWDRKLLRPGDGLWLGESPEGARVVRGGSWFNGVRDARASARRQTGEQEKFDNVGIRPARALER